MSKTPGGHRECTCDPPMSGMVTGTILHHLGCPMGEGVRTFDSGATRDTDEGKLDFEGFLAPGVLYRFAQYMHGNRIQSDGSLRDSDNWQKGIPREQYMKSMYRHFMKVWSEHRSEFIEVNEDDLCALMFNVMGYLFEMQNGR